jgi:hypothetical protein
VLKDVGRAVGKLNQILPRKKFILMGPGRWGSRDDIKLGVNVTYSDINNTALLIEIAIQKGNYIPDLSFGTHFFQDLVEAQIRYLPLYPDAPGIIFNERFFSLKKNFFPEILPEFHELENIIKVIDVPESTDGFILRILMNADEEEALAILTNPSTQAIYQGHDNIEESKLFEDNHLWRKKMAELFASGINKARFGISKAFVLKNSVEKKSNLQAGIDIYIHFEGNNEQKAELTTWIDGWSNALSCIYKQKTGYKIEKFLNVKFVTNDVHNEFENLFEQKLLKKLL